MQTRWPKIAEGYQPFISLLKSIYTAEHLQASRLGRPPEPRRLGDTKQSCNRDSRHPQFSHRLIARQAFCVRTLWLFAERIRMASMSNPKSSPSCLTTSRKSYPKMISDCQGTPMMLGPRLAIADKLVDGQVDVLRYLPQ